MGSPGSILGGRLQNPPIPHQNSLLCLTMADQVDRLLAVVKSPATEPIKIPAGKTNKRIVTANRKPRGKNQKFYPHGHHLNYFSGEKCRCDLCREAATAYSREKRRQNRENPPENLIHGRNNTYSYFGCRCRPCTDAALAHLKKYATSEKSRQTKYQRRQAKENPRP